MRVLGIETSCDETGVAIYDDKKGLLVNKIYSQAKLHSKYGGVVPELASRDHIRKTIPLIQKAIREAKLDIKEINAIAYTAGPGLLSSLLVGATISHALAFACNIPVIPVNHMEGHLLTPMMEKKLLISIKKNSSLKFPFLALLVSGGHTQLIVASDIGSYELLGDTLDDAVGEVFDKIANLLKLGYPGGPAISKLAKRGIYGRFIFPRPMTNKPGLNFSFSGLKTFVSNTIIKNHNNDQTRADIARAFEDSIVDTLIIKCKRALMKTNFKRLVISGGVSANYKLRIKLTEMMKDQNGKAFYASPELCTDNGAMIAYTGMIYLKRGFNKHNLNFYVKPNWSLTELFKIIN